MNLSMERGRVIQVGGTCADLMTRPPAGCPVSLAQTYARLHFMLQQKQERIQQLEIKMEEVEKEKTRAENR